MRNIKHLDISNHKIWEDKNIKPKAKEIFAYLYVEGFEKTISHLNVGEIQQTVQIKNKGLRKILEQLQNNNYLRFKEYHTGMYEYHIC